MKFSRYVALVFFGLWGAVPAHSAEEFLVECEVHGEHGAKASRLEHAEEMKLLQDGLSRLHPRLPAELRTLAKDSVLVVNHKWTPVTETFLGFSAEDDPDYKWPRTDLYHPVKNNDRSAVKSTVTEKFVLMYSMGKLLGKSDPLVDRGADSFFNLLIVHELTHVRQYTTKPAQSINTAPASYFDDGVIDPLLLEAGELKNRYEIEANAAEAPFMDADGLEAFGNALLAYEAQHPELFAAGAKYEILSQKKEKNPAARHYLLRNAKIAREGQSGKFEGGADKTYDGQYVPPRLLRKLVDENQAITLGQQAAPHFDVSDACKQFGYYINGSEESKKLLETYPYLAKTADRFVRELRRYGELTGRSLEDIPSCREVLRLGLAQQ